jgi:hypothetical protein
MEPEGSLPHSQVPATCPYPEPDRTTSCPTFHFLKIHLNIILPSTLGSPKCSLSLRFPHQNPLYTSPLPHARYAPRSSHFPRFDLPNSTEWGEKIIKLLIMQFSPLSCYLVPLRTRYSPQHPILRHSQPTFLPQCERPSFTPIQNKR